jgi:hypothetical protein
MSSPIVVVIPTLVYFQELATMTPEPTTTPTPNPVIAAWTPTPLPLFYPSDPAKVTPGVVYVWPEATPPTSTPFPQCVTPIPGDVCEADGAWNPPTPTQESN